MNPRYKKQLEKARTLIAELNPLEALTAVVELLATNPKFDWVGIYFLEGEVLKLGPYIGEETEHQSIKVGQGVCGTAVLLNENQVIEDVNELDNYIACSPFTRSEIVVLIKDEAGNILAQFDLDSDGKGVFGGEEEDFLENLAEIVYPATKKYLLSTKQHSSR